MSATFGETIRTYREEAGLSLRELARKVSVSAPFMSDVELGRRFPKEETLQVIATVLKIDPAELSKFDHREPVADLKRLLETDPALGIALRSAVAKVKTGKLTTGELAKKLSGGRP
jgi:transcriptional regulator with XRE-family HTH domain